VRLSEDVRLRLVGAEWPGNLRELENLIGRAVLRAYPAATAAVTVVESVHLDLADAIGFRRRLAAELVSREVVEKGVRAEG
jgi:transcriptional regulator with GAF, ATPase, and Fis domain